ADKPGFSLLPTDIAAVPSRAERAHVTRTVVRLRAAQRRPASAHKNGAPLAASTGRERNRCGAARLRLRRPARPPPSGPDALPARLLPRRAALPVQRFRPHELGANVRAARPDASNGRHEI